MISPQDQRNTANGTASPAEVRIAPGASVNCEVEGATDLDTLTASDGTTSESSSGVTYRWEAVGSSSGLWRWQVGTTTQEGASAPTRYATWTAPSNLSEETTFTLKCTIDDAAGAIADGEGGNRNDNPAVVRQVQVRTSNAAVILDVLRKTEEATATQAARYVSSGTGATGGQLYGALYLTVGQGLRVSSADALVRLQEMPGQDDNVTHSVNEDRIDIGVNFGLRGGWQKYYDPEGASELGWWEAPEAPSAATSSDGAVRYRYLLGWNSAIETPGGYWNGAQTVTGKLWGHNGAHQMSLRAVDGNETAQIAFTSDAGGLSLTAQPENKEVTIGNLIVTEVTGNAGNPDYIKFDPLSTETNLRNPVIRFNIEDDGNPHHYVWTIKISDTNRPAWIKTATIKGTANGPGPVSIRINQVAGGQFQDAQLGEWGTYTFDVFVAEVEQIPASFSITQEVEGDAFAQLERVDYWAFKQGGIGSQYFLRIPKDPEEIRHFIKLKSRGTEGQTEDYLEAGYYLEDRNSRPLPASKVWVDFYNPRLEAIVENHECSGVALNQDYTSDSPPIGNIEDYEDLLFTESKSFIAVLMGLDSHADNRRDHKPGRALATNSRYNAKKVDLQARVMNQDNPGLDMTAAILYDDSARNSFLARYYPVIADSDETRVAYSGSIPSTSDDVYVQIRNLADIGGLTNVRSISWKILHKGYRAAVGDPYTVLSTSDYRGSDRQRFYWNVDLCPNTRSGTVQPGKYKFQCRVVGVDGQVYKGETGVFDVGVRSDDAVVFGWIDGTRVTLPDLSLTNTGVNPEPYVDKILLPGGTANAIATLGAIDGAVAVAEAGSLLAQLSECAHTPVNAAHDPIFRDIISNPGLGIMDRRYALYWMFKHGDNTNPATTLRNGNFLNVSGSHINYDRMRRFISGRDAFGSSYYKLFNHLQIKYRIDTRGNFSYHKVIRRHSNIGFTKDVLLHTSALISQGQTGAWNGSSLVSAKSPDDRTNSANHSWNVNEGSPLAVGVKGFNTLSEDISRLGGSQETNYVYWEQIGSRIVFSVNNKARPRIIAQPYPTYHVFLNGRRVNVIPQATSPLGNFVSHPYPFGKAPSAGQWGTVAGGRNGDAISRRHPTARIPAYISGR
jgi:hypothetical protein